MVRRTRHAFVPWIFLVILGMATQSATWSFAAAQETNEPREPRPVSGQESPSATEMLEQLQRDFRQIQEKLAEDELARLIAEARDSDPRGEASAEDGFDPEQTFIARGLGLQALNPEISLAGDFLATGESAQGELGRGDVYFRVLDVHVESYLDPYSKVKAAVGVMPGSTVLGEAYATRFAVLPGFNVTAGKFRQQFGVVNRWHKHALDQIDFPLPLRQIFGPAGLNQTGFSFDWTPPVLWGASQTFLVQATQGENARLFGENSRNLPSVLVRYANFRDLTKDTYLDVGVTGLFGWNDLWPVETDSVPASVREERRTDVLGADLTVRWEPTDRMRYTNMEWRTELYFLKKRILAPDGTGPDAIRAWGGYSSLQRQLSRTIESGVRFDYYQPDSKSYAGESLSPLAVFGRDPYQWQVGPYVVWWQSPFVKLRLEVDYGDGREVAGSSWLYALQVVFAAGPHKHERY